MSLRELLASIYFWADMHAVAILVGALVWAVGGTLLARIGKGGASEQDGRLIASVVIGGAVLAIVVTVAALAIAYSVFNKGLFDTNVLLLLAPLICLACSIGGIHRVFPLNELATVRTLRDVAVFVAVCAAGLWLLSTFRGWGVMFLGGIGELVVIAVMATGLLRALYRRAFQR